MPKGISRRDFIAGVGALGVVSAASARGKSQDESRRPDLAVAKGPDADRNVRVAIEALGGIGAFVKPGQVVGVLANHLGRVQGARTKPEVLRTFASLCKEAGVKECRVLTYSKAKRWEDVKLKAVLKELGMTFGYCAPEEAAKWKKVKIPKGKALKEVRYIRSLDEVDTLIILPVFKQHTGCFFSGAHKIYMAVSHPTDNQEQFHRDGGRYLEQSIADFNTVTRPPTLIVMEAMEVITANGPFGPGPVIKPQKIVAGTDRVAVDSYCAHIQKVDPQKSILLRAARKHGLGQSDLSRLQIKEL